MTDSGNNRTVAWVVAIGALLAAIVVIVTVVQRNNPDMPATEQTAAAPQAAFPSRWIGSYRCQDSLGDGDTRYVFERDGDRVVRAYENWRRGMLAGTVIYDVQDTRSSNGALKLTTISTGGYAITFRPSGDGDTLNGVYEMHPNCQTIVLRPE